MLENRYIPFRTTEKIWKDYSTLSKSTLVIIIIIYFVIEEQLQFIQGRTKCAYNKYKCITISRNWLTKVHNSVYILEWFIVDNTVTRQWVTWFIGAGSHWFSITILILLQRHLYTRRPNRLSDKYWACWCWIFWCLGSDRQLYPDPKGINITETCHYVLLI